MRYWVLVWFGLWCHTALSQPPLSEVPEDWVKRNIEQRVVNLKGWLEPYERMSLYARVDGYLRKIPVDIGSQVEKGDILAILDVPDLEIEKRSAEARIQQAQAALRRAQALLTMKTAIAKRLTRLHHQSQGAVTQEEVDDVVGEWHIAEAGVQVKQAAIASAKSHLADIETLLDFAILRSPFAGIVTERLLHTGALVVAGRKGGRPILKLARVDLLRLVIRIPERTAPFLRQGVQAIVRFPALPGKTYSTTVTRMGGVLDKTYMRAEADLKAQPGLHPGMKGIVTLFMW